MQQNCSEYGDSCSNVIYQTVDVDLPLSLLPSINLGNVKIKCCNEPHIECCRGKGAWGGYSLRITQTVTYEIPIEYSVEATAGDMSSQCNKGNSNTSFTTYRY